MSLCVRNFGLISDFCHMSATPDEGGGKEMKNNFSLIFMSFIIYSHVQV
jgi:hypothetical protein